jgi:hypothetical protein
MKQANADNTMRTKVFEYFEFCWRKKKIFEKEILNFKDISATLERECLLVVHQDIL